MDGEQCYIWVFIYVCVYEGLYIALCMCAICVCLCMFFYIYVGMTCVVCVVSDRGKVWYWALCSMYGLSV